MNKHCVVIGFFALSIGGFSTNESPQQPNREEAAKASENFLTTLFDEQGLKPEFAESGDKIDLLNSGTCQLVETGTLLCRYPESPSETLKTLQKHHGKIRIDCQIFVQLVAFLLDPQSKKNQKFFLMKGDITPEVMGEFHDAEFGYVRPADKGAFEFLSKNCQWANSRGQWLIKSKEQWCGFGFDGIKCQDITSWKNHTRSRLEREIAEAEKASVHSIKYAEADIMRTYQELGKLDQWTFVEGKKKLTEDW